MLKFAFYSAAKKDASDQSTNDLPQFLDPSCTKLDLITAVIPQLSRVRHVDCNPNTIRIVEENGRVFVIEKIDSSSPHEKCTILQQHPDLGYLVKTYDEFDGIKKKVLDISSYTEQALFLVKDVKSNQTSLYGMGTNQYRQLADNTVVRKGCGKENHSPFPIPVFNPSVELPSGGTITHVACSFSFSTCVVNHTDIHMTGQNWLQGGNEHNWADLVVKTHAPVMKICAGNFHVCAITQDGSLYTGGSTFNGQCIEEKELIGRIIPAFASTVGFAGSDSLLLKSIYGFYHLYASGNENYPKVNNIPVSEIEDKYGLPSSNKSLNCRQIVNPFSVPIVSVELNRDYLAYLLEGDVIVLKGNAYNSSGQLNDVYVNLKQEFNTQTVSYKTGPNSLVIYEDRSNVGVHIYFKRLLNCSRNNLLTDLSIIH